MGLGVRFGVARFSFGRHDKSDGALLGVYQIGPELGAGLCVKAFGARGETVLAQF